jgi:Cu-Zn family superoxide dismutase
MKMKQFQIGALVGIAVLIGGCSVWSPIQPQAMAELKNAGGEVVAKAGFWEEGEGVRIFVQAQKLSPGKHGIHLHATGKCDPPDFVSAGGHYNPLEKKHGLLSAAGAHAGDLPNLEIGPDGTGTLHYATKLATLGSGPTSLFPAGGTALVIHAGPDDQMSDPSGNSGARIACGVITRTAQP